MKRIYKIILIPIIIALALAPGPRLSAQPHTSANYELSGARIVISGGEADSYYYSLGNVAVGNFVGGEAGSANYALRAGLIIGIAGGCSIHLGLLEPIGWQLGDPVQAGGTLLARVPVTNTGGTKVNLSLSVQDNTVAVENWQAGTEPGGNDVNTYVMSAIITGTDLTIIDEAYFNETGNEDVAKELAKPAGIETFATSTLSQNGTNIMPNEERYLYLKFDVPRADTTGDTQHEGHLIYVEVEAG